MGVERRRASVEVVRQCKRGVQVAMQTHKAGGRTWRVGAPANVAGVWSCDRGEGGGGEEWAGV